MFKIGEIYEVSNAMNGGSFSEFAVVDVVSQGGGPLCRLLSGKCEYNNAPGDEPGAWIDGAHLRPLTLRRGDYVACTDIKTDAEYDAVRDAFIAAGCEVDRHKSGVDARGRVDWDFFGWDSAANVLNRWGKSCKSAGARLLTPALVLSTVRAAEAKEWDGAGLPPAGTKCEATWGVKDVWLQSIVLDENGSFSYFWNGKWNIPDYDDGHNVEFRKPATEEHRLSEQLQSDAGLKPKAAARVIAAGYRKAVVL